MNQADKEKTVQKIFGRNLCAERNRANLSQYGLGNLVGKDGTYIGRIERGEINPTLTTVVSLMKALNISFESLYDPKQTS